MNPDFSEMLSALSAAGAEYLVVGAHALVAELASRDLVYQIGVSPARIDIMTGISGLEFDDAWPSRVTVRLGKLEVAVIGREALLRNKRAAGRPRDLADVAELEADAGGAA